MTRVYNALALRAPRLFGALYMLSAPRSTKAIDRLISFASRGDSSNARFARAHPTEIRASLKALADGCRQGGTGPTEDIATLSRPWGLDLGDIAGPVDWWHGKQDTNVSPIAGRAVTSRLPHASTHFIDGGHYVLFDHAPEIMAALNDR